MIEIDLVGKPVLLLTISSWCCKVVSANFEMLKPVLKGATAF